MILLRRLKDGCVDVLREVMIDYGIVVQESRASSRSTFELAVAGCDAAEDGRS